MLNVKLRLLLRLILESLLRMRSIPLGSINIGDYTTGMPLVISRAPNIVSIGKFCSISPEVTIIPSLGHVPSYEKNRNCRVSTYPLHDLCGGWQSKWDLPGDANFVVVGNDVWIGANAVIMNDISNGIIVGAGSVVNSKFGPYSIVAGNPGKIIKMRILCILLALYTIKSVYKFYIFISCTPALNSNINDLFLKVSYIQELNGLYF